MNDKQAPTTEVVEQDLNEILRIRRDKLSKLIEEGKNPFEIGRAHV